jgi:Acetyltransferase (isoleucine patch superfamily)
MNALESMTLMNTREIFEYMSAGKPYNDFNPQLVELRNQSMRMTNKINREENSVSKESLIKELFGYVGLSPVINPNFRCEFGKNIYTGDYFYANYDCTILDCAKVSIGNRVLFGPKVGIYTVNHLSDANEREIGGCIAKPITIENRCWLGAQAIVLPGVTIGNNTIIGAGSVVTHDIPSDVIAAGNPCKVLRKITDKDRLGFSGHTVV